MSNNNMQSKKCTESNDNKEIRWTDLTGFEGNVLYSIAESEGDEETSFGLAIKRVLQDLYDKEINHGRLYPALDDLGDEGLVEKSAIDKRTNECQLTDTSHELLQNRTDLLARVVEGWSDE